MALPMLGYLPIVVFVMLVGMVLFYKTRSIAVPLIILLAFITSVGAEITSYFGTYGLGLVLAGAFILGLVAVYLRYFY